MDRDEPVATPSKAKRMRRSGRCPPVNSPQAAPDGCRNGVTITVDSDVTFADSAERHTEPAGGGGARRSVAVSQGTMRSCKSPHPWFDSARGL